MSEPLPRCPTGRKGRHELCVVVPDNDQNSVLLFCSHCGITARETMELPRPLDDLPADVLREIAQR
jgi:hypothetical protein